MNKEEEVEECASIVFAIKRLHYYLDENSFLVITDHNPLVWLNRNVSSNPRLMQWALALQPYNFRIVHRSDHEVEIFTKNATNAYHRALAYIEKWYPFENQNYKTFSCLNLECGRLPTLDQLLELWSISPWKQKTPPKQIYDELAALQSVFLH
ncbi:transposon Tf2-9 polyprotein [Trichonephila clavipes]|nr:transposon Tf2-9 polyprotein [Trichonephila clavipes]